MGSDLARCGVVGQTWNAGGSWVDFMGGCGLPIESEAHALLWEDDRDWILWHEGCCPAPHPHVWIPRPKVERMSVRDYQHRTIRLMRRAKRRAS